MNAQVDVIQNELTIRSWPRQHSDNDTMAYQFVIRSILHFLIVSLITPRYSWNTAKVGVRHKSINQSIKGLIKISKLKKDRKHKDQNIEDKRKNNDLQNTTQETKDRATRTLLRSRVGFMGSGGYYGCCMTRWKYFLIIIRSVAFFVNCWTPF